MMSDHGSDSYFPSTDDENNPFLGNEVKSVVMVPREEESCASSIDDVDEFEMDE